MANSNTVNTVAALAQLFKKTQTGMLTALQDQTPELRWLRKTPMASLIPSGLEMRLILNVLWQGGGAMIPDGGDEATTGIAPAQYGTVTFVQYNDRFLLTGLGRMYDRYAKSGEVLALNYYSAKKVMEAMGRKIGFQTYGYSAGTVCLVDGISSGTTGVVLNLKQPYGTSLVASSNATATANEKTYMAQLFRGQTDGSGNGESIALVRGGVLVTNSFGGSVTSVSNSAGSITVTFGGSVTTQDGDAIVFSNTVTGSTLANTEYNLWPTGLFEVTQASSLYGLATTTAPNWASYTDPSGGRYGFIKERKGEQYINNYGGTKPDTLIMSNGVQNDATAAERSARIYSNTSQFDLDGNLSKKGVEIQTSLLAPPKTAFLYDSEVYTKLELGDLPGENGGPDLFEIDKIPNKNQWASSLNYAYLRSCTNRAAVACFSGLTEQ
jgi:hypothetical protein